jgi:ubiquinone/menaquinone biosynthesis C-methylase UbiE
MKAENFDKLLEIGTGSGIFLQELSTCCRQLYAIDTHEKIESVQKFCKNQKINANISKCSIESTNFPDNFFDAIIGVSVLEFIPDLNSAFKEIKRIIKPKGKFITICPQKSFLLDFILSFFTDKSPDEVCLNSRDKVSPMLEKSFKVIEKRIFPPILAKLLPVYNCYKLGK